MKTKLLIYFEVFDAESSNEYITSFNTFDEAHKFVTEKNDKKYSIDMAAELCDMNGDRITADDDILYSLQVFPSVFQYLNYNKTPELLEK